MLKKFILFTYLVFTSVCIAQDPASESTKAEQNSRKNEFKEEIVTTSHKVNINGKEVPYQATVGTQILTDCEGNQKASIFFTAYTREGVNDKNTRPITFCFNGGPGSSSVWLHLGAFGPKRVNINELGTEAKQPYHVKDNPYSLLDITDLVFVDPVSTGYSRACPVEDEKKFHGFEKDIASIADFIRLYITRNERWSSPKFLAGESYGTTRAAGLALELHENKSIYLDGILLISSVLNFQTIDFSSGNDLPYILFLPSYTAAALYHNKLDTDLQKDPEKTLAEAQAFAYGEYTHALMLGDKVSSEQRATIVDKLSRYIGIPKEYLSRADLRVHMFRFAKELLRDQNRIIGRFDSRMTGVATDLCNDTFEFDPSFECKTLFATAYNDYIRADLNWKKDEEYVILANVQPWDYGKTNKYLDVSEDLTTLMSKNTHLEIFVASGYNDLATPYFATEYTFSHLGLDRSLQDHVTMAKYEGGHMMFLCYPTLIKLKSDIANFMRKRLEKNS